MKFDLNCYHFFYQIPASPFAEGLIDLTAILLFYFIVLIIYLCWFLFRLILLFTWVGNSTNYVWVLFGDQEIIGWFKAMQMQDASFFEEKNDSSDSDIGSNIGIFGELSCPKGDDFESIYLKLVSKSTKKEVCTCVFKGIWENRKIYFFKYDLTQLRLSFIFGRNYKLWFINQFSFYYFLSSLQLIIFYYKYYYIFTYDIITNKFIVLDELGLCENNAIANSCFLVNDLLNTYSIYLSMSSIYLSMSSSFLVSYPKDWNILNRYECLISPKESTRYAKFLYFFATWIDSIFIFNFIFWIYRQFLEKVEEFNLLISVNEVDVSLKDNDLLEECEFVVKKIETNTEFRVITQYVEFRFINQYIDIAFSRFINLFGSELKKVNFLRVFNVKYLFLQNVLRISKKPLNLKKSTNSDIDQERKNKEQKQILSYPHFFELDNLNYKQNLPKQSLFVYYSYFFYKFCEISELWDKFFDDHVTVNNNIFLRSERITHNIEAELAWTFIPILFLIGMGIPSIGYLYFEDGFYINPIMSIKATGNQWYWTYQYNMLLNTKNELKAPLFSDTGNINELTETDYYYNKMVNYENTTYSPGGDIFSSFILKNDEEGIIKTSKFYDVSFNSHMVKEADLCFGSLRLLEVDQRLILPIRAMVRIGVTSVDVIHSWAVPALGKKLDAIPGRLNVTSVYISIPGVYYGQCSELCGVDHAFMPIVVEGVETIFFMRWLDFMKSLCSGEFLDYESGITINVSAYDELVITEEDSKNTFLSIQYVYKEDIKIPW